MAAIGTLYIEVEVGPVARAALDALELVEELLEIVPEHEAAELRARHACLAELFVTRLNQRRFK